MKPRHRRRGNFPTSRRFSNLREVLPLGLGALCAAAAGCGAVPRPAAPPGPHVASEHDAEWHWARREDLAHLRTAIALYQQDFGRQPSVELCHQIGRAAFLLADYFLEGNPAAQDAVHLEAARYALAAMRLQPSVAAAIGGRDIPPAAAVALVDAEYGRALFWWTAHFGRWLAHRNILTQLAHTARVIGAMERIRQLGAEVAPGSSHRMWGAYYARRGDFARARKHFEEAVRLAPHIIYTRILYATDCALPARDKELYVQQLRLALAEPPPSDPDWLPDYRLERQRARRLLEKADELFAR